MPQSVKIAKTKWVRLHTFLYISWKLYHFILHICFVVENAFKRWGSATWNSFLKNTNRIKNSNYNLSLTNSYLNQLENFLTLLVSLYQSILEKWEWTLFSKWLRNLIGIYFVKNVYSFFKFKLIIPERSYKF